MKVLTNPSEFDTMHNVEDVMEEWSIIMDYEDLYEVSTRGRVRSVDRFTNTSRGRRTYRGKVLKQSKNKNGSMFVCLSRCGERRSHQVARLVLGAFLYPALDGNIAVHLDGDKSNNNVENLRWKPLDGRENPWSLCSGNDLNAPMTTNDLSDEDVVQMRVMYGDGVPVKEIAKTFGVSDSSARDASIGKTHRHVEYTNRGGGGWMILAKPMKAHPIASV